mgnify:CR=1 FL=1
MAGLIVAQVAGARVESEVTVGPTSDAGEVGGTRATSATIMAGLAGDNVVGECVVVVVGPHTLALGAYL